MGVSLAAIQIWHMGIWGFGDLHDRKFEYLVIILYISIIKSLNDHCILNSLF
jgi:hypothetical protein